MQEVWRLFAAIEVTPDIQERIARAANYLRRAGWSGRWVSPENSHLTLKFFGNVPLGNVTSLGSSLMSVVAPLSPFELQTTELGVFPSIHRPRIVWLGVDGRRGQLEHLQERVEIATEKLGYEREQRPYHGHITVGRLRPDERIPSSDITSVLAGAPVQPSLPLPVNRVTLFRSETQRTGPVYTIVDHFALDG